MSGSVPLAGQDTASIQGERPIALEKIEVRAEATSDQRYHASRTRTATKTETPLANLPQSLTVVTLAQMRDQQMTSMGDIVRYVPGVSAHQGENNRDQIIFRGQSSSADFFLNGVRDDVPYYRDAYNLDRVEILRGPNAMTFGRGGGGGVINRSTKEAGGAQFGELAATLGSFAQQRFVLDVNQPLSPVSAVRLNALWEDANSFRRGVRVHRTGVNPSLTLRPSSTTKIAVSYERFRDTRTADRGITSWQGRPAPVSFNLFYGNPADSQVGADVHLATSLVQHRTAAGWEVSHRTQTGEYDRHYQNYVPGAVSANQDLVALTAYANATRRRNLFHQTDITRRVDHGGRRHTLLAGIELGRQLTTNFRTTGYFNSVATTLAVPYANPTTEVPVSWRPSASDADNHVRAVVGAIYVQDQIEIGRRWQAVAGLRCDRFDLQYYDHRTRAYLGRRDAQISPRTGIVYKPRPEISIYGSYSVSYLPSAGDQFSSLTNITQQLKPEIFSNRELGAKLDLPRDAFLTAAIYQLDRTNTRATDPLDPTRILQTGSQRSTGLEIGLTGTLSKGWTSTFGYAYQDANFRHSTTAARAGANVAQVPRHSGSMWSKFQLGSHLSLGLGVIHRTDMFAAVDNTVIVPGYTRVDAAVFITPRMRWRAQVNIENLTRAKYYLNADGNTNISPGAPLTLRASVTTRF